VVVRNSILPVAMNVPPVMVKLPVPLILTSLMVTVPLVIIG